MCVLKNTLADINMKSFTILAFGLVVLVAISVASPVEPTARETPSISDKQEARQDEDGEILYWTLLTHFS